jgi:oligopeptidase A
MLKAKNFNSGLAMLRQLEFALFDFKLHSGFEDDTGWADEILAAVRTEIAVITPPEWIKFAHSFNHIFAGGYAAGYYSYKWAEVLSADAFVEFEKSGVLDRTTGLKFKNTILEQGGSRAALDLFVEFKGRKPSTDALLQHSGISQ